MNATLPTRRRPTDTIREARRLSQAIADALGTGVRQGRRRLRLTQAELAAPVGVHQSWISRIEIGRGQGVPLQTWIALGVTLGQPLAVAFSRPLGVAREPTDAGHLAMQERLLILARDRTNGHFRAADTPRGPVEVDRCVRPRRSASGPDHRGGLELVR